MAPPVEKFTAASLKDGDVVVYDLLFRQTFRETPQSQDSPMDFNDGARRWTVVAEGERFKIAKKDTQEARCYFYLRSFDGSYCYLKSDDGKFLHKVVE